MDTSLSLETKKGSRWRWWWHFKEVWKLVHHWAPPEIWPGWFVSRDNHNSLISVIDLVLLTCLSLFIHRQRNSVFASTSSSWLSRPPRAGFCPVSVLTSLCSGPTDEKSSFYEEDCGLYFFHFVLLDTVFRSTSEQSRKIYSIKHIQFKINYLRYFPSTVFVWLLAFFIQGLAIWSCGSKPSTGDDSWRRTDYCDVRYLNRVIYFFVRECKGLLFCSITYRTNMLRLYFR